MNTHFKGMENHEKPAQPKNNKKRAKGATESRESKKMRKINLGCTESVCCLFTASTTWALKAATANWKTRAKGK